MTIFRYSHSNFLHYTEAMQQGFSLLEILIALVIIAQVLLGIVTLQIFSLREVSVAYQASVAWSQAAEMLERLRANTSSAARDQELSRWQQQMQDLLPQAVGNYQCLPATHWCHVQV